MCSRFRDVAIGEHVDHVGAHGGGEAMGDDDRRMPGRHDVAAAVGVPAGTSFHLSLNNMRLKDNRIPPRGFTNAAFDAFDGGRPIFRPRSSLPIRWSAIAGSRRPCRRA